ncbi:MAG TPA: hypothetical protein VGH72_33855 [Pseudonocardia sp.]|jgi:hypothetical protein
MSETPKTIVKLEIGVAGGWRVVTLDDGEVVRCTMREVVVRTAHGEWRITPEAKVAYHQALQAVQA